MKVLVVAPDACWEQNFSSEARVIRQALGRIAAEIHHIGSTSIPGIYAKPIIDILVEATSIDAIDDKSASLKNKGYETMGEFGISGRRYFRKNNRAGIREFHVHGFACGSPAVEGHLAFRDYLRAYPDIARGYSDLWRSLAKQYPSDEDAYVEGKAPFIKSTEEAALRWRRSA